MLRNLPRQARRPGARGTGGTVEGEGVTIDDCQFVSTEVGTLLDVEDIVGHRYTLEVSSPGLDRPLRGPADYRRFTGCLAQFVLGEPVDGLTHVRGRSSHGRRRRDGGCRERPGEADTGRADLAGPAGSGVLSMAGSSNPVQQTIEALAKERGIDPQVVIAAIEDAVLTASRKVFRGGENLKARFNPESGHVDLVAVRTVVETVENPATEISLAEARETYTEAYGEEVAASIELGDEMEFRSRPRLRPDRGPDAKQVIFQKSVRPSARTSSRVQRAHRRGRHRDGEALRERRHHRRGRPHRDRAAAQGTVARRELRAGRIASGRHQGGDAKHEGPQIVLSRTDPALLTKLFEQEVPRSTTTPS